MEKNTTKYLLTGLPGMLVIAMICIAVAYMLVEADSLMAALVAIIIGAGAVFFGIYRTVQMSKEDYEDNRNKKRKMPSDILDNDMFF